MFSNIISYFHIIYHTVIPLLPRTPRTGSYSIPPAGLGNTGVSHNLVSSRFTLFDLCLVTKLSHLELNLLPLHWNKHDRWFEPKIRSAPISIPAPHTPSYPQVLPCYIFLIAKFRCPRPVVQLFSCIRLVIR